MSTSFQTLERPTKAYIDLDALAHNFHSIKDFIGGGHQVLAVVKADAYGHGAVECAARLEAEGIDWFGVAIPEEGVELRKAGITRPILCLGSLWPGQEHLIVENGLTPVVFAAPTAERLNSIAEEFGRTVDIHVKIDTGMGRLGVRYTRAGDFAEELKGFSRLRVAGLLTHFASAEDPAEDKFTLEQIEHFSEAVDAFVAAGHDPEIHDLANSPGAIRHIESRAGMVRIGGGLYGLLDDILVAPTDRPEMRAVMSLRSRIAHVKTVPAGESLGYGRTFFTERESRIALIPIGYADGYPRMLSNRAQMLVSGKLAPVVGRVSMDWTEIDVTDIPAAETGDEITLIGSDGVHSMTAATLAAQAETIGYEITCGISPRVPRVYV